MVVVVVGQPITNPISGSSFDVSQFMFDPELNNSQLSLPVLAGQVGDLVWDVYVSVPNPVSIRGSTKYIAPY